MYIGIDLGTSGLKALLITDRQDILAESTQTLGISRPIDGWSEQNPSDWIVAAEKTIDELAAKHSLKNLHGIGLSGHMHGAVLLDATDRVLRPCILWNVTRSHSEAAEMDSNPMWRNIGGNIVFPGFTAPKLAWVANNEPEIFDKIKKILLPKDYLRLWLTGEHVTDMSDAAGTSWLNTGARDWSDKLLSATGPGREQMPGLVEGSQISGTLRKEIANRWSIPEKTIVAGGCGDNAASAIGVGVVKAGDALVSLGT